MKSLVAVIAGLVLAAGAVAPASANVFAQDGQDPRVAQTRADFGRLFMPIGAVIAEAPLATGFDGLTSARTRGTGFLVSPCHILTNYHAVFGTDPEAPVSGRQFHVNFVVGDGPLQRTVRGTPVYWGAFNRRVEHDWALVRLDECVGARPEIGWVELESRAPQEMAGMEVTLAAFPADRPKDSLWRQTDCRVRAVQDGTDKVLHDCAVVVGASGGPIIDAYRPTPAAVAIQCGELNASREVLEAYDPRRANTAVTVDEVFRTPGVREAIAADIAAYGRPNPALWSPPDYQY